MEKRGMEKGGGQYGVTAIRAGPFSILNSPFVVAVATTPLPSPPRRPKLIPWRFSVFWPGE